MAKKKVEKEMLPRYYQLAKEEVGMQEVYNSNENLFNFITNIKRLIDRTNKTINVNGQNIGIKDYKFYLNNQILQESKYMEHDNVTVVSIFIGALVTIIASIMDKMLDKDIYSMIFIIVWIIYLAFLGVVYLKVNFLNRRTYVNNIGFYQLILDILNET